jgi:hypothetical protein
MNAVVVVVGQREMEFQDRRLRLDDLNYGEEALSG